MKRPILPLPVLPLSVLLLLAASAGCGEREDRPRTYSAAEVMRNEPGAAAVWPALLQHCLRNPGCDPLSDFGLGAGSASGVEQQTAWVAEKAADGSATIRVALAAPRGTGGEAGRLLTLEETPASLRMARERTAWVVVEHEVRPAGPEPRRLTIRSAHLALTAPVVADANSERERVRRTAEFMSAMIWPDGGQGARITVSTPSAILFTTYATGAAAVHAAPPPAGVSRRFVPWMFEAVHDLPDASTERLLGALAAGETLALRIATPAGAVFEDAVYAIGYPGALRRAQDALADPAIAEPLTVRCAPLMNEPDAFWVTPDVSPAHLTCDPRPPEKRHADQRAADSAQ